MTTLVLIPTKDTLRYWCYGGQDRIGPVSGEIDDYRVAGAGIDLIAGTLHCIHKVETPCLIAIRAPYGGEIFRGPTQVDEGVFKRFGQLIPEAPLHIPAILHLIRGCDRSFAGVPIVLDFETGFFVDLPSRESAYGLTSGLSESLKLRRYGYHGIFHQAAAGSAIVSMDGVSERPDQVVSICLEPQPEIAAVIHGDPIMVTGGLTPLEGLPGETTCGEIDPGIILTLAEHSQEWGAERINVLLTQESGLFALASRRTTVEKVLMSADPNLALAAKVLRYRILLACGAAKAVMGGINAIVFSGRYADAGRSLASELAGRLASKTEGRATPVPWQIIDEALPRIIADRAGNLISETGGRR